MSKKKSNQKIQQLPVISSRRTWLLEERLDAGIADGSKRPTDSHGSIKIRKSLIDGFAGQVLSNALIPPERGGRGKVRDVTQYPVKLIERI